MSESTPAKPDTKKEGPKKNQLVSKPGIVPQFKGVDIVSIRNVTLNLDEILIIRSDLGPGYYLRSKGDKRTVTQMPIEMKNSNHYFVPRHDSHENMQLYMVRDTVVGVMDLDPDPNPNSLDSFPLHANCQGGDHYMGIAKDIYDENGSQTGTETTFYIIFKKRGIYLEVTDLQKGTIAKEYNLHDDYKDALYFWGSLSESSSAVYFLKQVDEWGRLEYCHSMDLSAKQRPDICYLYDENYISFLPGGTSLMIGPTEGRWNLIKKVENCSDAELKWSQKVTHKVGYNKSMSKTFENHWDVSASAKVSIDAWIFKAELSFSAGFGGSESNTEGQDWSDEHTNEEDLTLTVPPNGSMSLWQFSYVKGGQPVLLSKYSKLTRSTEPPIENPLPRSKWFSGKE